MIFTALITFSIFLINFILSIFPASDGFPPEVSGAVNWLGGYVGILSPLVPLSTMGTILSLIFLFEISVFGFKGFKWMISHMPVIGGKG